MKKMVFGKAKAIKKEQTSEEPDLVTDNPSVEEIKQAVEAPEESSEESYVGMPGFVPNKQASQVQLPVAPKPPVAPTVVNQFQVVGSELVGEGVYRYIILTNKKIGEIGEVYEF